MNLQYNGGNVVLVTPRPLTTIADKERNMAERHSSRGRFTKLAVGDKFHRLTIIERIAHPRKRGAWWMCRCDCGNTSVLDSYRLTSGLTKSCGCIRKENQTTHGLHKSPEYAAWQHMRNRCGNPNAKQYADYGGRGISVCDRWLGSDGFINFYADMGQRPSGNHSIDRIDVDGGYDPSNCRWATKTEQQNNRRDNNFIEWNGVKKTATEWARNLGASVDTIKHRVRSGWPIDIALTKPPYHRKDYKGRKHQ